MTDHTALISSLEKEPPVLEAAYPDDDCGCPVEEWLVGGVNLVIHFEADGQMEMYADTGDWEANVPLKARTFDEARQEAFAWVYALPIEDALQHQGGGNG